MDGPEDCLNCDAVIEFENIETYEEIKCQACGQLHEFVYEESLEDAWIVFQRCEE